MRQGTATTSAPDRLESTTIRQGLRKEPRDVRPARHPVPRQVNPPADDRRAWFVDGLATGRSMIPSRRAPARRTGTSRCPSTTTLERAPHEGGGSRVRPRGCNLRSPSLRSRLSPSGARPRRRDDRPARPRPCDEGGSDSSAPADSSARECAGNGNGTERVSPAREKSRCNNGWDERERDGTRTRDHCSAGREQGSGPVPEPPIGGRRTGT